MTVVTASAPRPKRRHHDTFQRLVIHVRHDTADRIAEIAEAEQISRSAVARRVLAREYGEAEGAR